MRDYKQVHILALLFIMFFFGACKQNPARPLAPAKEVTQIKKAVPSLNYEVRQPIIKTEKPPVLILLHGLGSNQNDLFSFASLLPKELLVICPQAPISLSENRYSWFTLDRSSGGYKYNIDEVVKTTQLLMQFIDEVSLKYNIDRQRIYIGGFSQGAITTLGATLLNPTKIAGLLCLSGNLYPEFKELAKKSDKLPAIFISHGEEDAVLDIKNMESAQQFLEQLGYEVNFNKYKAGHTIPKENLRDMIIWLSSELK